MLRIYSLNFNQSDIDFKKLHLFLASHTRILGYWNYIPGVIFIKSYALFDELRPAIQAHLSGRLFVLAEISKFENTWLVDGLAPAEAWNWFRDTPTNKLVEALAGVKGP